jgi:2-amino-4-hydroxy-6-hydroxymethyldihydropteridine diphosphokinase
MEYLPVQSIIQLGSNSGDRKGNLSLAIQKIEKISGRITGKSSLYKTAAWGITEQPSFYNIILIIQTSLPPPQLIASFLGIEESMGRIRMKKWEQRIIDIDILFYEDLVLSSAALVIPHPELEKRRFVLEPLAEIVPEYNHPLLKKNIKQLLSDCRDDLEVVNIGLL